MKAFHFTLEKALEWRQKQLQHEEAKLRSRVAAVAEVDRARDELRAAVAGAEVEVRRWNAIAGADLAALDIYRRDARAADGRLAGERERRARDLAAQQAAMVEARRRCRLLERLKERRWAEWKTAADRELEGTAAESYLARWKSPRERAL